MAGQTTAGVEEWLERAKEFHGHICPFLSLGVRVGLLALEKLGVERASPHDTIEERLVAIVEVNNCMADGIQVTTGCTLGNNSLIYADTGRNAVTLFRRETGEGVRIYVDWEKIQPLLPREGLELFRKVVEERRGTPEEAERLGRLWEEAGRKLVHLPEEYFKVEKVKVTGVEPAPIFESVRCVKCGELVMKPKAVLTEKGYLCPVCAGVEIPAVVGRGITKIAWPVRYE